MKPNYKQTVIAGFLGISNQAVITNVTAVLFVHFMLLYDFQLWQLGVLVGVNFGFQMLADILLTFLVDRIGFRPLVLTACGISVGGLLLYGLLPLFVPADGMFYAVMAATSVFAFASGMCEVLLSPIIDNLPDDFHSKETAMSLMHSFYAWGQVFCVVTTSLYLRFVGSENWGYIIMAFAAFPAIAFCLFSRSPLPKKQSDTSAEDIKRTAFSSFFIVALFAILLGGASEVLINQWVSTFLVKGLAIDKTTADLFGMALFAVCLGLGRAIYGKFGQKWNLHLILITTSFATFLLYLVTGITQQGWLAIIASVVCGFTVSLLWPGTLSITSKRFPTAGAWLFAVLAVFGDTGAMSLPMIGGFISESMGLGTMFLIMSVAPLGAFACHLFLWKKAKTGT